MNESFTSYNSNSFALFLKHLVGRNRALKLLTDYNVGTAKQGDTIFWLVDMMGFVRTGKVIKYNLVESTTTASFKNCKRDKTTAYDCLWMHKKGFNFIQCYFGVHLLTKNIDKK